MQLSIRNQIQGKILEIQSDAIMTEVIVETAAGPIAAVITTRSAKEMGLKVGDEVAAVIKATNVSVSK
ncbi:MAG: TOBE domain-containing protein [Acidithiobacillus sp.]|jgi:molybdopterin-binding protein|nr:TOBE domain-containing protein [Acidithiobacillus sp.]